MYYEPITFTIDKEQPWEVFSFDLRSFDDIVTPRERYLEGEEMDTWFSYFREPEFSCQDKE